jgi:hypothetical protein
LNLRSWIKSGWVALGPVGHIITLVTVATSLVSVADFILRWLGAVDPKLRLATLVGVAFLAIVGVMCFRMMRKPPDISWTFDSRKTRNDPYFLGFTSRGREEPRVICFQARGRNNLVRPIRDVSGYIRSDVAPIEYPVLLVLGGQLISFEQVSGIPNTGQFEINSEHIPSDRPDMTESIPVSKFLTEFGPFSFVFEYDGSRIVRRFTVKEIKSILAAFQRDYLASTGGSVVRPQRKNT